MNIRRVTPDEYRSLLDQDAAHVYNTVDFSELNRGKCDDLHYLVLGSPKVRLGIILGERGDRLLSPFSAPFGGFSSNRRQNVDIIDEGTALLAAYGRECGKRVEVTLPPDIYDEATPKVASSMMRAGTLAYADISYHYPLSQVDDFEAHLSGNARNKWRNSLRHPFATEILSRDRADDIRRAYRVIQANRESHGYPLRMTLDDVIATAPLVHAEFMVMTYEGADVAAAQIHRVTPDIGQVVYWGDAPGFAELLPMNRFTHDVLLHCRRMGMRHLDIGPSSEDGLPSYGLCEFKETLGCLPSLKYRFLL